LTQWEHLRIREVDLDGETVTIELPDLAVMSHMGIVPNPLREAIAKIPEAVKDEDSLSSDELKAQILLQGYVIGHQMREPNLVEELGSIEAAQDWVINKMPPEHRKRLWDICLFHRTSDEFLSSLEEMRKFRGERGSTESVGSSDSNGQGPE